MNFKSIINNTEATYKYIFGDVEETGIANSVLQVWN